MNGAPVSVRVLSRNEETVDVERRLRHSQHYDSHVPSSSSAKPLQRSTILMTTVNLHVESPDTASERRYDKSITVGQLKVRGLRGSRTLRTKEGSQLKLETVTGILAGSQVLTLCRSESDPTVIVPLNDADKSLESYGVQDLMMIKVGRLALFA